jgi:hypothetical protein
MKKKTGYHRSNEHTGHDDIENQPLPPIQHVQRAGNIVLRGKKKHKRTRK